MYIHLPHPPAKDVFPLFPLGTTNYLADVREQNIHRRHGLLIVVQAHVKGLEVFGVVAYDDRFFEVLLHQPAFVLGLEVSPPLYREFKLLLFIWLGTLNQLDRFGVCDACEVVLYRKLQHLD